MGVTNSNSTETKSLETKSLETKSLETKSLETKSLETKSLETKSLETKSLETKSFHPLSVHNVETRKRLWQIFPYSIEEKRLTQEKKLSPPCYEIPEEKRSCILYTKKSGTTLYIIVSNVLDRYYLEEKSSLREHENNPEWEQHETLELLQTKLPWRTFRSLVVYSSYNNFKCQGIEWNDEIASFSVTVNNKSPTIYVQRQANSRIVHLYHNPEFGFITKVEKAYRRTTHDKEFTDINEVVQFLTEIRNTYSSAQNNDKFKADCILLDNFFTLNKEPIESKLPKQFARFRNIEDLFQYFSQSDILDFLSKYLDEVYQDITSSTLSLLSCRSEDNIHPYIPEQHDDQIEKIYDMILSKKPNVFLEERACGCGEVHFSGLNKVICSRMSIRLFERLLKEHYPSSSPCEDIIRSMLYYTMPYVKSEPGILFEYIVDKFKIPRDSKCIARCAFIRGNSYYMKPFIEAKDFSSLTENDIECLIYNAPDMYMQQIWDYFKTLNMKVYFGSCIFKRWSSFIVRKFEEFKQSLPRKIRRLDIEDQKPELCPTSDPDEDAKESINDNPPEPYDTQVDNFDPAQLQDFEFAKFLIQKNAGDIANACNLDLIKIAELFGVKFDRISMRETLTTPLQNARKDILDYIKYDYFRNPQIVVKYSLLSKNKDFIHYILETYKNNPSRTSYEDYWVENRHLDYLFHENIFDRDLWDILTELKMDMVAAKYLVLPFSMTDKTRLLHKEGKKYVYLYQVLRCGNYELFTEMLNSNDSEWENEK